MPDVRFSTAGGSRPAYAVVPPGARRGVVVLHEVLGRQPEIDRVVDRFAAAGYAAIAPDFFAGRLRALCIRSIVRAVRSGAPEPIVGEVHAARAWLAREARLPPSAIGLIGFCMGGGFALACGPEWGAISTNYGDVPPAERLRGMPPIIGCYGGRDVLFAGRAEVLERRLRRVGVAHEVHVFPSVGHSFLTDGHHPIGQLLSKPLLQVRYDPAVAEEGWRRILVFFDRHIQRAPAGPEER
jgi:carboxymethylenebutenolidase